jgi:hypothetical protein
MCESALKQRSRPKDVKPIKERDKLRSGVTSERGRYSKRMCVKMGIKHGRNAYSFTTRIYRIPTCPHYQNSGTCRGVSVADTNVFIKAGLLPGYRLPTFGLIFFINGTFENDVSSSIGTPSNDKLSLNSQLERTCNEAATAEYKV